MNPDPKRSPTLCTHCGADVTRELAAGLPECAACCSPLPEELFERDAATDQRRWRRTFWIIFFATPFLTLLIGLIPQALDGSPIPAPASGPLGKPPREFSIAAALVAGATAAGYCFMKQRGETLPWWQTLLESVVYAVVILIVYTGILMFGCSLYVSVVNRS